MKSKLQYVSAVTAYSNIVVSMNFKSTANYQQVLAKLWCEDDRCVPYNRGEQLIWLDGHFEKTIFSEGPYLLLWS